MGQVLQWGLLQGEDLVGVAGLWGGDWCPQYVGGGLGVAESDRGRFDEEVLGGWIRGEDVEAFSNYPYESVKAWLIIISGEGKVMGVTGGAGGGVVLE